jgi:thiamine biosynthesis lipoprotein
MVPEKFRALRILKYLYVFKVQMTRFARPTRTNFLQRSFSVDAHRFVLSGSSSTSVAPLPFGLHKRQAGRSLWIALLISFVNFAGRAESALKHFEFQSPHMGTVFTIQLYAANAALAERAATAAFHRVAGLEQVMSDYQADSELMRLCDQPFGTPVPASKDLFEVLEVCQKFAKLSDGAFDVTVGPYVRLWRFSRKRGTLPSEPDLKKAREAVGWRKLRLDEKNRAATLLLPGMKLDLGGIGKGFAADAALRVLKGMGIDSALVAGSGDIAIGDPPPGELGWVVGIGAIDAPSAISRTVLLKNAGISTSGDTEQFVEIKGVRYSHIVNTKTGLGMTNRLQATIIGPDATTTDALDTTVSLLGIHDGLKLADSLPHVAAVIFRKEDNQVFFSKSWKKIALPGPKSRP